VDLKVLVVRYLMLLVGLQIFLKTKKNTLFGIGAGVYDNNINYKFNILKKL
jgi:hypothetical protein